MLPLEQDSHNKSHFTGSFYVIWQHIKKKKKEEKGIVREKGYLRSLVYNNGHNNKRGLISNFK